MWCKSVESTSLDNKRICYSCGSNETRVDKRGGAHWYLNKGTDLYVCEICFRWITRPKKDYAKYIRRFQTKKCDNCGSYKTWTDSNGKQKWHPRENDKWLCHKCYNKLELNPRQNPKKYRYRNRRLLGWFKQKTGYCSKCTNNIYDRTTSHTQMHHIFYFIIFPWAFREELCMSCHTKETWKKWKCMKFRKRK